MGNFTKLKTLTIVLLLILPTSYANDDTGNANDYIDEVLTNLRKDDSLKAEFDPLAIPQVSEKNLQLSNGIVNGLSNLYRHGDCTLTYDGNVVTVGGDIAVRDVTVHADYRVKALFFWIKGKIDASLDNLAVRVVLSVKDGKAELVSFKVIHLGEYKIRKITGMSVVLNWMLKLIANSIAKKSRGKIILALEDGASKALSDVLKKVDVPFY